MKTTVVNVRGLDPEAFHADPRNVYVGRSVSGHGAGNWRGSIFGNPYKGSGRAGVIDAVREFEKELRIAIAEPDSNRADNRFVVMARALPTLRGKRLGCWCTCWDGEGEPDKPCHAVVLARLADEIGGGE